MVAPDQSPISVSVTQAVTGGHWRPLRIGAVDIVVSTYNPLRALLEEDFVLSSSVYSHLLGYGASLGIEPDLAVRWIPISTTTWELALTDDAYFVDRRSCTVDSVTGQVTSCPPSAAVQVTAEDVRFSYDLVYSVRRSLPYLGSCVDYYRASSVLDSFRLTIEFSIPYGAALATFACVPILPRYLWESQDPFWSNDPPVGSGPYLFRSSPSAPPLVLDRNPLWHGAEILGRPFSVDTAIYSNYPSDGEMVRDLALGGIDLALGSSPERWKAALAAEPALQGQIVYSPFVAEQAVNVLPEGFREMFPARLGAGTSNPLLREWVVRAAIHMATDRQKMLDRSWLGLGAPADTLVPITHPSHYDFPDYSPDDKNGDGFPFDFDPGLASLPNMTEVTGRQGVGGVPSLLEEFPHGLADSDGDGMPDALARAKDLLHAAGWVYDCRSGALDTPAVPALPLCRRNATGALTDRLEFRFATLNSASWWKTAAEGVVQDAARVGIKLNLALYTTNQMSNQIWWNLDYDVWLWDWSFLLTSDVLTGILNVQLCRELVSGTDNDNGYCPRDSEGRFIYDGLYNRTLTETDPTLRRAMTDELQSMIYDYGSYNLPFYRANLYAHHSLRWRGWGNWSQLPGLPPDIGNPTLLGQFLVPVDDLPPEVALPQTIVAFLNRTTHFAVAAIDPEGSNLTCRWDFDASSEPGGTGVNNDGILDNDDQGSGPSPLWTFTLPEPRDITVRITQEDGRLFTVKRARVNVYPPMGSGPLISATLFVPSEPLVTDPEIRFAAIVSDPADLDLTFFWSFGDGTTAGPNLNDPLTSHAFRAAGVYTVTITVRNPLLIVAEASTLVPVGENLPSAVPSLRSRLTLVGIPISFVSFSFDPNPRDKLTFEWDFGDGSAAELGNPVSHTYTRGGNFTVSVTVRDLPGGHAVTTSSFVVVMELNQSPNISSLVASPRPAYTTLPVTFTASASDPNGDALRWDWDFQNDGIVDRTYTTDPTAPSEPVLRQESFLYVAAGVHYLRLTVTDLPPFGQAPRATSILASVAVYLNHAPALSSITMVPENGTGYVGEAFTFLCSVSDLDDDPLGYAWSLGDGTTQTGVVTNTGMPQLLSASHGYTSAGTYLVTLTLDDGKGGLGSAAALATVLPLPAVDVEISAPWSVLYYGQTMDLTVMARAEGQPLPGALVALTTTPGATVTPTMGTTNSTGAFRATVRAGSHFAIVTITANVSKSGYENGTASFGLQVGYLSLTLSAVSDSSELMSYEAATIRIRLTRGDGTGVSGANITVSSPGGGNVSAVTDYGDGYYSVRWDAPKVMTQTLVSLSVRAKAEGYLDATQRLSLKVDPNVSATSPLHQLFLLAVPAFLQVRPGEPLVITVYVFTIEGYVVRGATVVPVLRYPWQGAVTAAVDLLNGKYTFTYFAAPDLPPGSLVTMRIDASKSGYSSGSTSVRIAIRA